MLKTHIGESFNRKRIAAIFIFGGVLLLLFFADSWIREALRSLRTSPGSEVMGWVSFFGIGIFPFSLSLLVFLFGLYTRRAPEQQAGKNGMIAVAFSGLFVQVIKHLFGRSRPGVMDAGIFHPGYLFVHGYDSFPSGHAASSFALAFTMTRFYPRGKFIFYGWAVLVSFSRLYLDAHFASDAFAGAGLGIATGMAVFRWGNAITMKKAMTIR
jgi:membrane-associated phospholipid phosphatase